MLDPELLERITVRRAELDELEQTAAERGVELHHGRGADGVGVTKHEQSGRG